MNSAKPSYEELEKRLETAEAMLKAIRLGHTHTLNGEQGTLVVRLAEAEAREAHIKQVLLAIRNVNQLITKEMDRQLLIEQTCTLLTETMGYHNAWIALVGDSPTQIIMTASSGFQDDFLGMQDHIRKAKILNCMSKSLSQNKIVIVQNPPKECPTCPYSGDCSDRAGMAGPLTFEGKNYGVLVVSVPSNYVNDQEAQNLFSELIGDISFALHKIDLEERRIRAEKLLVESKELLDAAGRIAKVGGWELDAETLEVSWTDETYRIHELPPNCKPSLESAINFYHLEERAKLKDAIQGALQFGEPFDMELRFITAKGKHLWTHASCKPEMENGKTVRLRGTFQDITQRKMAEEELEKSEARYRRIVETAVEGIWEMDGEFRTTFVNMRMAEMLGFGPEEMLGRTVHSFMFDEDLTDHTNKMQSRRRGENQSYERRFKKKDGRELWTIVSATALKDADGKFAGSFAMFTDITERRIAQEALRSSEERFDLALQAAQDALWDWDMKTGAVFRSERFFEMLDCSRQDLSGQIGDWHHLVFPDDYAAVTKSLNEYLCGKRDKHEVEFQISKPSGEPAWILSRGRIVSYDETGRPLRMIGTHTDVTDRRKIEEALKQNEQLFRTMFERHDAIMLLIDPATGNILDANFSAERFYGFTRSELLTKSIDDINTLSQDKIFSELVKALSEQTNYFIFQHRLAGGELRTVEVHSSPIDLGGRKVLFSIIHDITERIKAETELSETTERLRLAAKATNDVVWDWNIVKDQQLWDESATAQFGWKEIVSSPQSLTWWLNRIHPDDRERISSGFYDALQDSSRSNWEDEYQFRKADGTYSVILDRGYIIRDDEGQAVRMIGALLDITQRKQIEESLRLSQAMLSRTESIAHVGSWEWDVEADKVTWSEEMFRIFDRNPADGAPSFAEHAELYSPEDMQRLREVVTEAVKSGMPYEIELRAIGKDGQMRHCLAYGHVEMGPDEKATRLYGSMQDITDRKQVEHELRETNRRLQESQRIARIGTWEWHPVTGETYWSDETYRLFGLDPGTEEPSYELARKFAHPEDAADWESALSTALDTSDRFTHDYRAITTDGSVIWLHKDSRILRDETGKVIQVLGTAQEITERKQAEQNLKESEENFRSFFETLDDLVFVADPDGNCLFTNDAVTRKLGYLKGELYGRNMLDLHPPDVRKNAENVFEEILKGRLDSCSFEVESKTGKRLPVENRIFRGKWNGQDCLFGICKDLSKERSALEKFSRIFNGNPALMAVSRLPERKFSDVNERFQKVLGYEKEELIGKTARDLNLFVQPEKIKQIDLAIQRYGCVRNLDVQIRKKDGSVVDGLFFGEIIEALGEMSFLSIMLDVSDIKRAQQALSASEARYRGIFENAAIGIDVVDADGKFLQINEAMASMLGYSRDELLDFSAFDITHPDDRDLSARKHREMVSGETQSYRFEKRYIKKGGDLLWADMCASPVRGPDGNYIATIGVVSDISDRKRAEEALIRSESRVRAKLQSILSPDGDIGTLELADVMDTKQIQTLMDDFHSLTKIGMEMVDLKSNVLVSTGLDAASKLLMENKFHHGYTVTDPGAERDGKDGSVDVPDYLKNNYGIATPIMVGGQHLGNVFLGRFLREETDATHADGDRHTAVNSLPHLSRETVAKVMGFYSKLTHMMSTLSYSNIKLAKSIAEQERLLNSLRESEERYRAVVDNLHVGISVINRNMEIVAINPFFQAYYPHAVAGEGQICYATYNSPPKSSPCSYCPCVLSFQDGEVHERETDTPAGNDNRHYRIISCPVKDEHGNVDLVIELVEDVTESRSLHAQLAQAQKMEAIGTLAGGVAHDFNNILQVALGYSEFILQNDDVPEHYRADLQKIHESAKLGSDLVKRLLTFSRKTEIRREPLDLNLRITELRKMLQRTLPKMVDIQLILDGQLAKIHADPTQIEQVLMNLAVNARDAMPNGGRLVFETTNIVLSEKQTRTNPGLKPGDYVRLVVRDTGSGIDKADLEHIFEPFYTTKAVGEGTGLGLPIVHGIVTQHDGFINCESEYGEGTTFNIYFPALVADESQEGDILQPLPQGGTETVLLVDDEEFIRDVGSRFLSRAGYKVLCAANGQEGLEVFKSRMEEISVVILDLMMPHMGGRQCMDEILKLCPSAKIIIASGYHEQRHSKDLLESGAKGFINKPYEIRQLLGTIRTALDSR